MEIILKMKLFDKTQQPHNSVKPFERNLRGLFKTQAPYIVSSFLDLRIGSSRSWLYTWFPMDSILFSAIRVCMLFGIGPHRKFAKLRQISKVASNIMENLKVLEKNFGGPNSQQWRGLVSVWWFVNWGSPTNSTEGETSGLCELA